MTVLNIDGFNHLDRSIIVTSKLAKTLDVETILTVAKNKISFETSICKAMGLNMVKKAEHETGMGLSYHIINSGNTKAYKIYLFDRNNSDSLDWMFPNKGFKKMLVGHPKYISTLPEGWSTSGYHLGDIGALVGYDYILFNHNDENCALKDLYLKEVFGSLGT